MPTRDLLGEYLSGSLASSFTYTLFSPLEVVKTRLQLQDASARSHFGRTLVDGLRQDGILTFWSHGLVAGIARDFFYSGFRTGMYPTVRDAFSAGEPADFLEPIISLPSSSSIVHFMVIVMYHNHFSNLSK